MIMDNMPRRYLEAAIKEGHLRINAEVVAPETVVPDLAVVSHTMHRHEPTIRAENPLVLAVSNDRSIVATYKPAGVPIHACGFYRSATHSTLLSKLHDDLPFAAQHRLDRVTSGAVLVAVGAAGRNRVRLQIQGHRVTKVYLARVKGDFRKTVAAHRDKGAEGEGERDNDVLRISVPLGHERPADPVLYKEDYSDPSWTPFVIAKGGDENGEGEGEGEDEVHSPPRKRALPRHCQVFRRGEFEVVSQKTDKEIMKAERANSNAAKQNSKKGETASIWQQSETLATCVSYCSESDTSVVALRPLT
ncbi:hypothetical protein KIPB_006770, partial [Kipferlia bialata]|eukprot:g6770.t1